MILISGKKNFFDPASAEYAAQSNLLHFLLIVMGFRWLYIRYVKSITEVTHTRFSQNN